MRKTTLHLLLHIYSWPLLVGLLNINLLSPLRYHKKASIQIPSTWMVYAVYGTCSIAENWGTYSTTQRNRVTFTCTPQRTTAGKTVDGLGASAPHLCFGPIRGLGVGARHTPPTPRLQRLLNGFHFKLSQSVVFGFLVVGWLDFVPFKLEISHYFLGDWSFLL